MASTLARTDRLIGALAGLALGDALGAVVEMAGAAEARAWADALAGTARLRPGGPVRTAGQVTDDTQSARALLESVVAVQRWDPVHAARHLAAVVLDARAVGFGPGSRRAALRIRIGAEWPAAAEPAPYAGNGAAMRVAPLAVLAADVSAAHAIADEQARITHAAPASRAAGIAVAALACAPGSLEPSPALIDLVGRLDAHFADGLAWVAARAAQGDRDDHALRDFHALRLDEHEAAGAERGCSAHARASVLWGVYAALRHPAAPLDAIRLAIRCGGDTDTMAAIAGALVGARVGPDALPVELLRQVHDHDRWRLPELEALARRAAAVAPLRPFETQPLPEDRSA
jgi:poly(ADP-ribose) glycohydrolase ARH3